jgi:hypothetical protein
MDSHLTEKIVTIFSFLVNNEEQLIKDMRDQVKDALDVASLFKGQSYIEYTKGIRSVVRSNLEDVIRTHFVLNPEELLLILEDTTIISFIDRLQNKTIKDVYEYKNTLH